MRVITHHKGKESLKMWYNVVDVQALYNSILANRGIDAADLDIYQVVSEHKDLVSPKKFEIVNDSQIDIKHEIPSFDQQDLDAEWFMFDDNAQEIHFSAAERAAIARNKGKASSKDWEAVPSVKIKVTKNIFAEETLFSISVSKLNPFS